MIIKKMRANFGCLEKAEIELPNEAQENISDDSE